MKSLGRKGGLQAIAILDTQSMQQGWLRPPQGAQVPPLSQRDPKPVQMPPPIDWQQG